MTTLTTRKPRSSDDDPATARQSRSIPPAALMAAVIVVVALAEYLGNSLSLWWITLLAGIAAGWVGRRGALVALTAGTVLAWAVGILLESGSRTFDVGGVLFAMAFNARSLGWTVVIVAVIYAVLMALAGAWLGGAARRITQAYRGEPATPDEAGTPTETEEAASV